MADYIRRMNSGKITPEQLEKLLPFAAAWAAECEQTILQWGEPLSDAQVADAKILGVIQPEQVRLLRVPMIPRPNDHLLGMVFDKNGLLSPDGARMTLRYGIFVHNDYWGNRPLIAHELVHTVQYERFGSIEAFLRAYLLECTDSPDHPRGQLERESIAKSAKLFGKHPLELHITCPSARWSPH